jgi:hypothetical protein
MIARMSTFEVPGAGRRSRSQTPGQFVMLQQGATLDFEPGPEYQGRG